MTFLLRKTVKYILNFSILKKIRIKIRAIISDIIRSELSTINYKIDDINRILYKNNYLENVNKAIDIELLADSKIAFYSPDHLYPRGTLNDDTRCPSFVFKTQSYFQGKCNHLDLGCAGGGLVYDFNQMGNFSLGIEGSDVSKLMSRANWKVLPNHLRTADITKNYKFISKETGENFLFDIITAWEVMEHIAEEDLFNMISNISRNLRKDGLFVCSIATFPDYDPATGVQWHVTIQEKDWWIQKFSFHGFQEFKDSPYEIKDFPRGSGNPLCREGSDWNAFSNPEKGFHLVLKKTSD